MLSAEPKAEADKSCQDLDYLRCHKKPNLIIVLLIIVLKKKKRQTHRRKENELTLLLESCIARATYRLVSYLLADSSLI